MKMLVVFLLLLKVSQHALTVVVEVNQGEESVLLSCLYSGSIPEDNPTVMWTRNDLDPKYVHLRGEEGDDIKGQNQHYSGRTSINVHALLMKDFSLTLRDPTMTDSGNYTCSISNGRQERRLRDIQLQVKDQQVAVKVEEGSESVILPCKTTPDLPKDTRVEWTRSDLGLVGVHVYANRSEHLMVQDGFYRERTKMNEDLLRTGDLSLTLKQPTQRDTGGYICTIHRDKDILRQKVVLQVKEPFPPLATALLVVLVLLVVSGGLLFYFRQYFMSDYKVVLDSGVESVQLPCKTIVHLPRDAKVEWKNNDDDVVHIYQSGSDRPNVQHQVYRDRTKMKRNLLKIGDLSLTLKYPTERDTNTYTCTISREENILMKKDVLLHVRVPQVEKVNSGVESVQLHFKTTVHLPEDVKVEWTCIFNQTMKVHVYENGSDKLGEQHQMHRGRTEISKHLLRTRDLSLTLKYPTDWDTKTYTCTVYSGEGNILMKNQVELRVTVCQMEVDSGEESVHLPFRTTESLPEDTKVVWWDDNDRMVYVYENSSNQSDKQDQVYRDRTMMNEDPLNTGDLSLTLKYPTEEDSMEYTCKVYGNIHRYKKVVLKVKVPQVEVEEGAESVRLPFKITENLPEDTKVTWRDNSDRMVHVYGSDRPEEQHQDYRGRTKMNKDLLKTGDLSLTLDQPTEKDSGEYRCEVSGNIWRVKTVQLTVKGSNNDQTPQMDYSPLIHHSA